MGDDETAIFFRFFKTLAIICHVFSPNSVSTLWDCGVLTVGVRSGVLRSILRTRAVFRLRRLARSSVCDHSVTVPHKSRISRDFGSLFKRVSLHVLNRNVISCVRVCDFGLEIVFS